MVRELDFAEIRKQVAIRHNVLLGQDDPILVTVTINDMVLSRHLDLLSERCDEAQRALTVSVQHQVEQSKEIAGRLITEAADYVAVQVHQAVDAALTDAIREAQQQLTEARSLAQLAEVAAQETQRAKVTVLWVAALGGLLIGIVAVALVAAT